MLPAIIYLFSINMISHYDNSAGAALLTWKTQYGSQQMTYTVMTASTIRVTLRLECLRFAELPVGPVVRSRFTTRK